MWIEGVLCSVRGDVWCEGCLWCERMLCGVRSGEVPYEGCQNV